MSQKTDAQLTTQKNEIKNETIANANSATRIGQMFEDMNDSKINNDKIDTAVTLDTVGKTLAGRDALKTYIANVIGGISALSAEDIDTIAELNAIITDADLANIQYVDDEIAAAVADSVEDTIVDGETGKTASQNAIYDALVLKADKDITISTQSDSFILALVDRGTMVEANKATAITATVPPNSDVAFPIGTEIRLKQTGAGLLTVVAGTDVIITPSAGVLTSPSQYAVMLLTKKATNTWYLENGVAATGSGGPAIAENYADIAAMLADQANQDEDALYFVTDASTDASVDSGWAVYRKKAATTGAIGDYDKLSEEESLDLLPGDLSGPVSSTDNAVPLFNGTTGKLVKNSAIIYNSSTGLEIPASTSFWEADTATTDGNSGVIFNDDQDIGYRVKDQAGFDFLKLKSSDSGYGKAFIISQKQVNNHGQGFETVRRQFKLVLPNTTAATAHIIGSIDIPSGYAIDVKVVRALAFATNGSVQGCEPFGAVGVNSAGTTSGTATTATAIRITASTGGFSIVFNNTTDTADLTFTNETGTGRQYDVLMDIEYILYPIPV